MSYNYLPLDRKPINFRQVKNLLAYDQHVSITFDAHERITLCREYLDRKMSDTDKAFYGINTGFGYLQHVRIENDQLTTLQENLIKSHACGLGELVPIDIVKLMMVLKIKSLSYGYSGIHIETVKRLMEMYNEGVYPVVYTQGSLGASGDLAPLSHLSLPLIGEGRVWYQGQVFDSKEILEKFGWSPLKLHSKEGLALINGTQFMSAYGMYNLIQMERLLRWSDILAAISLDAFGCTTEPLDERIHQIRNHKGQRRVAENLRKLLAGSELAVEPKSQVQDAYSFRCVPQVHGASLDCFEHVLEIFIDEINSVTDNPNIFPDDDKILSGGNFHGQALAMALDYLSIASSELGSISERRVFQLLSGKRELPLFLVKNAGLASGLMIPQYVAAGIVSENKQLCTPASADSIPSSNNQEDHVSMGAYAGVKCQRIINNTEKVLAIELLTAAQAIEFRKPRKTSAQLENILAEFRKSVSFNTQDRVLKEDMENSISFIRQHSF